MNLKDKIRGAMIGSALGNALGLGTEFMTRSEVSHYYPDGIRRFSQIIRDAHRCLWKRGEWTGDIAVNILLAESLMAKGKLDVCDFASRMKEWYEERQTDVVDFYHWLFKNPEWTEHPLRETHDVWLDQRIQRASNEALPRAVVIGIFGGERLLGNSLDVISVTHDDSRCTSSGVLISMMADSLLRHDEPASMQALDKICKTLDPRTCEMLHIAYEGDLDDIEIDDPDCLWHTRKTMAAALWTVWHCDSAEETLHKIVDAGGDADTNAAVAMGLAGLRFGTESLPDEANNLVDYDVIEDVADRFADFISSKENI